MESLVWRGFQAQKKPPLGDLIAYLVRRPESNKAHNLMFYNYYLNKIKSKDHQNDPYSEVYQNNLKKRLLT